MEKTKFLTSVCVILASFYGTAFGAASVRALGGENTAVGAVSRAGTMRARTAAPVIKATGTTKSNATGINLSATTDSSRLATLPSIGGAKLGVINSKLSSPASSSALADLSAQFENWKDAYSSDFAQTNSTLEELKNRAIDEAGVRGVVAEVLEEEDFKGYTDTKAENLVTEKITPLSETVRSVKTTAEAAAPKTYVDTKVREINETAFNETRVNDAIDTKVAAFETNKIAPLTEALQSVKTTAEAAATKTYVDNNFFDENKVKNAIDAKLATENYKEYTDNKVAGFGISMQVDGDMVQYKSTADTTWKDLADKATFAGASGVDGKTPMVSKSSDGKKLVYTYDGETEEHFIANLEDITGKSGTDGCDVDYEINDYTVDNEVRGKKVTIKKVCDGTVSSSETFTVENGVKGDPGANGNDGCDVDYDINDYTVDNEIRGKRVTIKKVCAGTISSSENFVIENGTQGADACTKITSEYKQPEMSGNVATTAGYLRIAVADTCNNTEEVYKNEDTCKFTGVEVAGDTTKAIYACSKQDSAGTAYKMEKTDSLIGTEFKELSEEVDKKANKDDIRTPQVGFDGDGKFCTCVKPKGMCENNPRDYTTSDWECVAVGETFQGADGCSMTMDEPVAGETSLTLTFHKVCSGVTTETYVTTVPYGQNGADSCYTFETTYTGPSGLNNGVYSTKGHLKLDLTPTGKCDGTSAQTFTYDDVCAGLSRFASNDETVNDIWTCTRYDNKNTYEWSAGVGVGAHIKDTVSLTKTYVVHGDNTPGYVKTIQNGQELAPKYDECTQSVQVTANTYNTRGTMTKTCTVQSFTNDITVPNGVVAGTQYTLGSGQELPGGTLAAKEYVEHTSTERGYMRYWETYGNNVMVPNSEKKVEDSCEKVYKKSGTDSGEYVWLCTPQGAGQSQYEMPLANVPSAYERVETILDDKVSNDTLGDYLKESDFGVALAKNADYASTKEKANAAVTEVTESMITALGFETKSTAEGKYLQQSDATDLSNRITTLENSGLGNIVPACPGGLTLVQDSEVERQMNLVCLGAEDPTL